jgi:TPR repeat protein
VAQFNLAFLYQNGLGVPLNYAEAYNWLTFSANKRNPMSAAITRSLDVLKHIVTESQLLDGEVRVSEWTSYANNIDLEVRKTVPAVLDRHATAASVLPSLLDSTSLE